MVWVLKGDIDGRMNVVVLNQGVQGDMAELMDLSRLDREQIPGWIEHLREAEASVRRLRGQLEAVLADEDRRCPVCGRAVTGRADQVYCGAACRQRARRAGP